MNHLKTHVMFYLGLAQLVAGWLATADLKTLTFSAAALSMSGLLTLVGKYVQQNLPDQVFTQPPSQAAQPQQEKPR